MMTGRMISIVWSVCVVFVGLANAEPITAGTMLVASGIGAGASLLGNLFSAWMTNQGLNKQIAENRRAEGVMLQQRGEDIVRDEKHWRAGMALQKQQLEMSQADQKYARIYNFLMGFQNTLQSNVGLRNNLINLTRTRRI